MFFQLSIRGAMASTVSGSSARTTPLAHTTAWAVVDSKVMVAAKASAAVAASRNERMLFSRPYWLWINEGSANANLLLLGLGQHLLAGRRQLVGRLVEAGNDPPAARHGAFAIFLEVAHAGVALRRGQFLCEGGWRSAQNGCGD